MKYLNDQSNDVVDKGIYYFYGIIIILLVAVISVYDIALTTTTTISSTSYAATAFSNESAADELNMNAKDLTVSQLLLMVQFIMHH